jgi:F-type H+-transporting ATPase subunit delta
MKIPKEARKLSRSLFQSCFSNGRFDPAKAEVAVREVIARRPRQTLGVLKNFERLVRLELERRHAVIESATPLEMEAAAEIMADLRARFGSDITHEFKINPALIGGVRIRLGSTVWDGSVSGRLDRLATALN